MLVLVLLLVAGADCWRWGSVSSCPPGPEPVCPENPAVDELNYFPHPTDCHYYFQCDGSGRPICRRCSPTTYFSPINFNCVWPVQASCEHNDTTRPESLLPPTCVPDRECNEEGATSRDFTDCSRYFVCHNGSSIRMECPEGQAFNDRVGICDDAEKAGCDNTENWGPYRCDVEGKIVKIDCSTYTICKNSEIKTEKCNAGQFFDEVTGVCQNGPCEKTCEDKEDPADCRYYIKNCDQRTKCPENKHFNRKTKHCENECTAGCQNPTDIPQCRECQQEGQILQYDCHSYAICMGGKISKKSCSKDQHFDVTTGTCIVGTCGPTPPPPPPPTCEDQPDPYDCNYYIRNCKDRTKCPDGQHFNRNTKHCENQCTAGCQDPRNIPQCRECADDGKILKYDCQSYVACVGGKVTHVVCRSDQHFNLTTAKCEAGSCDTGRCEDTEDPSDCSYYLTNCNERRKCPTGQHFNKNTRRCEDQCTAGCVDPSNISECHTCEPEGKTFEDPCSCETYYRCVGGVRVLAMCDDGLHYNNTLGRCDVPCSDICPKLFARKPECCASTKGKPQPLCPSTPYSVFLPHPSDSRWFYQCLQGVLYCNRCPPGHKWNTDEDTCDKSCQCP